MDDVVNALERFLRANVYVRRVQARAAQSTSGVVGVEGQDSDDDDDDDRRMPPPLEPIPNIQVNDRAVIRLPFVPFNRYVP
ncbi:unnamed protein product [Peniophora sp. CBMAI 1063]|nr:unnamed protein product [Peniophora sp. CBMAI 1063]